MSIQKIHYAMQLQLDNTKHSESVKTVNVTATRFTFKTPKEEKKMSEKYSCLES